MIQRNFFKGLLNTVRGVIPMLTDVDEKHYAILSSMVTLKFLNKDDTIYEQGDPSEFSYIVIRGMVKVSCFTLLGHLFYICLITKPFFLGGRLFG